MVVEHPMSFEISQVLPSSMVDNTLVDTGSSPFLSWHIRLPVACLNRNNIFVSGRVQIEGEFTCPSGSGVGRCRVPWPTC